MGDLAFAAPDEPQMNGADPPPVDEGFSLRQYFRSGRHFEHESDAAVFAGFRASKAPLPKHSGLAARGRIETRRRGFEEDENRWRQHPDLEIRKVARFDSGGRRQAVSPPRIL